MVWNTSHKHIVLGIAYYNGFTWWVFTTLIWLSHVITTKWDVLQENKIRRALETHGTMYEKVLFKQYKSVLWEEWVVICCYRFWICKILMSSHVLSSFQSFSRFLVSLNHADHFPEDFAMLAMIPLNAPRLRTTGWFNSEKWGHLLLKNGPPIFSQPSLWL